MGEDHSRYPAHTGGRIIYCSNVLHSYFPPDEKLDTNCNNRRTTSECLQSLNLRVYVAGCFPFVYESDFLSLSSFSADSWTAKDNYKLVQGLVWI